MFKLSQIQINTIEGITQIVKLRACRNKYKYINYE